MLPEETNSTTVEGHLQRIMGFLSGGVGLDLSKQKVSESRIEIKLTKHVFGVFKNRA